MEKRIFLIICYMYFYIFVYSQNIFDISYSTGYTICNTEKIDNNFNQKLSFRYLYYLNKSTYIGGVMNISDYNHDIINGHKGSFGTIGSLGVSILHKHKVNNKVSVSMLIENGLAYVYNPYDSINNPENTLGGRLQIFFNTGFYFTYNFKKSSISIGPEFTHFSNSGLKQKNGGLNTLSLSVRYNMSHSKKHTDITDKDISLYLNKLHFDISGGIGFGDNFNGNNDVSLVASTSILYNYYKNYYMGLGIDYFGKRDDINKNYIGLSFMHEIAYGNIVINAHIGYYINGSHCKTNEKGGTRVYEKIGMKYIPSRKSKFYIGYYVKGNEFTAECLNTYIGFKI